MGFERERRAKEDDQEAIKRACSRPEFRNRLDAIVPFKALQSGHRSIRVVDKFVMQLEAQLGDRGVDDLAVAMPRKHHGLASNRL
jgi:ATP-dependent Clp protease ATP-binding subunit ClpA